MDLLNAESRAVPPFDRESAKQFAVDVVRRLRAAGHQAFFAGGCVRDQLLGRFPKDYDVATDARPERVRELFGHRRTLAIGAAFGVISVLGPPGAGQVEVATFRSDLGYSDGRRPDAVAFCDAEHDAERRDFSINGLFFDPIAERVIDYVGGEADLRAGVVRAIGDARERFREDRLRMLRGIRFAARFGFQLEAATRDAIREMAPTILEVSAERIAQEMRLMLREPTRAEAMERLAETGLLAVVLPEAAAAPEWEATLALLRRLETDEFPTALAAALRRAPGVEEGPAASQKLAKEIGARWRLSNDETSELAWLLAHDRSLELAPRLPWSAAQPILAAPGADELLAIFAARAALGDAAAESLEYCREKRALPRERLDPPPLVTGDDLIAHGVRPGKRFKSLLERTRAAQLDGETRTREESLALVDRLLATDPT